MSTGFVLHLQSAARYERVEGVTSFVGRDASGSFGILPGRAPFVTVLDYGLARFCLPAGRWDYLACPGAVLTFADNELFVNTRRYLRHDDYEEVSEALAGRLAREEADLQSVKDNLQRLEHELFKRLRQLERGPA